MTLEFVDHRHHTADDRSWMPPFDPSVTYENSHWWDAPRYSSGEQWFAQVVENGIEVARIEFDDPGQINSTYAGVPEIGDERLEIQLVEVAAAARGRTLGTQVVLAIAQRHRDRRLFAYSEGADQFWRKLGWEPFYDPQPGPAGRTLFIQAPAR